MSFFFEDGNKFEDNFFFLLFSATSLHQITKIKDTFSLSHTFLPVTNEFSNGFSFIFVFLCFSNKKLHR